MSEANTRDTAIAVVRGIGEGALPLGAFAEDATWWMLGQGTLPVRRMDEIVRSFHATRTTGDGRMDIVGVTADGDRVAVEAEATYPLTDGRIYNGDYHFLLRFENGLIREVREYFDTAHAAATFAPKPSTTAPA